MELWSAVWTAPDESDRSVVIAAPTTAQQHSVADEKIHANPSGVALALIVVLVAAFIDRLITRSIRRYS